MKTISLFVAVMCLSLITTAQTTKFGIKGGLNLASINDEDRVGDGEVTPRVAYHFGGLVNIALNQRWAIQPELVYSSQGAKYDFPGYVGTDKLDYINIPVMVQFKAGKGFFLQTGPQIGFLTSAHFKTSDDNEDIKDDLEGPDFSWAFGLGYMINSKFGIDARYNLGLKDMYKDAIYADAEAKHRVGQLGVFYLFN